MNLHALFHAPQSEYAVPASLDTLRLRLRTAKGDISRASVSVSHKYDEKPIGTTPMHKTFSDSLFDYFECDIKTDRGRRVYHFVLTDRGGETFLYTESGAIPIANAPTAYFPHFQVPFVSESDVHTVPDKFKATVIYQIFPDRFYTKNPKTDWSKKPGPRDFFGGELYGATEKLDYIKALGANAVYVTPIYPSHTNHHYDVEDYYKVADDLGGDAAFKSFVDRAHVLGINVILDGVFNHCSAFNPMFRDVTEKGRKSAYYDYFIIDGDKPDFKACNYQTFARRVAYMPKFNCDNPKVVEFVCDAASFWLKEFGIDAWRLDVGDDVAPALWREVRKTVKSIDKNAIMIGEDWMDPSAFLRGDVFDGVMNYGFARAMRDFLAFGATDASGAASALVKTYMRTSLTASRLMMNLIGSHDTHRFLSLCGGDEFKHMAALSVMFFYEGMPTVYYGDELPMFGEADPDCRRGFDWNKTGGPLSQVVSTLAKMRTEDPDSLLKDVRADGGALIMERSGAHENTLVVNITDKAAKTALGEFSPRSVTMCADGKWFELGSEIAHK